MSPRLSYGNGGVFEGYHTGIEGKGTGTQSVGVRAISDSDFDLHASSNASAAIYATASPASPALLVLGQLAVGSSYSVSGDFAIALGTSINASGDSSIAIGHYINTNNKTAAMILGDSDPKGEGETLNGINDHLVARFYNGYWLMTSGDDIRSGIQAPHGSNAWSFYL